MKKIIVSLLLLFMLAGCQEKSANTIQRVEIGNLEEKIVETIAEVEKSTFLVKTSFSTQLIGIGSGFVYKVENGLNYLLTNEHVISDGNQFNIYDGISDYAALLIGFDEEKDIAVLTFRYKEEIKPLPLRDDHIIKKGQNVIAIGTPIDIQFFNTATTGVVGNWSKDFIQHDAAINPGNSGGPLFDIIGNVIGINVSKSVWADNTSKDVPTEGLGFSINVSSIIDLVNKIDKNTKPIVRPTLGITVMLLKNYKLEYPADNDLFPSNVVNGIVIAEIQEGSVSMNKLQVKDLIVSANSINITELDDLKNVLNKLEIGQTISFSLYRNKVLTTVTLTL